MLKKLGPSYTEDRHNIALLLAHYQHQAVGAFYTRYWFSQKGRVD